MGTADGAASQEGVRSCQYFWEAFPSGSGPSDRTTYLFRCNLYTLGPLDSVPSAPAFDAASVYSHEQFCGHIYMVLRVLQLSGCG